MLWRIFCNENAYHPCYRLNPYCVLNPYCMPFVNLNNLKIEMKVRLYIVFHTMMVQQFNHKQLRKQQWLIQVINNR